MCACLRHAGKQASSSTNQDTGTAVFRPAFFAECFRAGGYAFLAIYEPSSDQTRCRAPLPFYLFSSAAKYHEVLVLLEHTHERKHPGDAEQPKNSGAAAGCCRPAGGIHGFVENCEACVCVGNLRTKIWTSYVARVDTPGDYCCKLHGKAGENAKYTAVHPAMEQNIQCRWETHQLINKNSYHVATDHGLFSACVRASIQVCFCSRRRVCFCAFQTRPIPPAAWRRGGRLPGTTPGALHIASLARR